MAIFVVKAQYRNISINCVPVGQHLAQKLYSLNGYFQSIFDPISIGRPSEDIMPLISIFRRRGGFKLGDFGGMGGLVP